jgi:hypothetical protein
LLSPPSVHPGGVTSCRLTTVYIIHIF